MSERPIPFLKPGVPPVEEYLPYLHEIDRTHMYSNYGPLSSRFESEIVERLFAGSGSAVTVSNATSGLALALRLLARATGRYVLMPSFTFAATPLAAIWAGFEPYYVDIDPDTWAMDPVLVRRTLDELGDKVAAVAPYATFGANIDLAWYGALHSQGTPVVVDAAASLGSSVDGVQFGAGFPGVVVYSMHATKPFSVGEAGLVYSQNDEQVQQLRRAGNFGFGVDRAAHVVGTNTKLPEMTAAVALAMLERFPARVRRRHELNELYRSQIAAAGLEGQVVLQQTVGLQSHQFMPALLNNGQSGSQCVERLAANAIQARQYFAPACHQQPALTAYPSTDLSVTESVAGRIISLPLWDELTPEDIRKVVGVLGS